MSDHLDGLPSTIRVGPFDLNVLIRDELDEDSWGIYTHGTTIEIKRGQPSGPFAVDTIMHEIGHAIYNIYGMAGDEEKSVSGMAYGWTQVFRDNPALLVWVAQSLVSR